MYSRILVAMDMSQLSKQIFAQALSLAQKSNVQMMLLHVLSSKEENSPMPIPPDITSIYPAQGNDLTLITWQQQWEAFQQAGIEFLNTCAEEAARAGIQTAVQQISGDPGDSICTLADNWHADLIVVGRRGRSGLKEILLGSVSNFVLHHAPCSVLIVQ